MRKTKSELFWSGCKVDLYYGDAVDVVSRYLKPESMSLIATDPIYSDLSTYSLLAPISGVLMDGGMMLAILPHGRMAEAITAATGDSMRYWWTLAMVQTASVKAWLPGKRVFVNWKPVGWWIKGTRPDIKGRADMIFESGKQKTSGHPWQQTLDWAEWCLAFSNKGAVIDPMVGSGTIAVACANAGIHCIGIDRDLSALRIARSRLEAVGENPKRR